MTRHVFRRYAAGAFTLIELLLVLVILTALAAVIVPRFTKRSEQARVTAARTDISNLEVALDAFEVDTGRYPTSDEGLRALQEAPAGRRILRLRGRHADPHYGKGAGRRNHLRRPPCRDHARLRGL